MVTRARGCSSLSAAVAFATALVVSVPTGVAAFTFFDEAATPRYSIQYCVESAPDGVSVTRARTLLTRAINHWHAAPDQDDGQALSLTQDSTLPCASGSVRIRDGGGTAEGGETDNANNIIRMYGNDWWDGTGSQGSDWEYEGVLVHEMGHTFGIHHAGDSNWTYDGGYLPTMTECVNGAADTAILDTIQQDEWGGAAYVRGGARRYWNANPGFEKDFSHWAHSSGTSTGSSYAITGSRGVRIPSSGKYVYMTSVYDPWATEFSTSPPNQIQIPGMDITSPTLHVFGFYRHYSSSTTGGVDAQYRRRFLRYDGTMCKRNAFIKNTGWSAVTNMTPTCADPGTSWSSCNRTIAIDNSETNDATVFRAYIRSTSSSTLYVDKVGAYGGTSP